MNKKFITLITLVLFTLAQLQGCSTTKSAKQNAYASQNEVPDFTDEKTDDASTVILISAGVIAVIGLSVLGGILLMRAAAKGMGQELGGHIA